MAYKQKIPKQKEKAIKEVGEGSYKIDMSKVKSDDPLAYSVGYIEGKEGRKISDNKNLAPAYVEGFNKGKEERTSIYGVEAQEPKPIEETYEAQTNKTPQQSISYLQEKNANVSKHNWSFEVKDDKTLSLTLGSLSDAGWYWDGNEKDIVGFTYRLHQSKVEDEFYTEMKKNDVSFNQLKPLYIQSANEKDGLYEISGDNTRWQFGETGFSDEDLVYEEKFTESQKEKFYEDYNPINYEEFEEKYGEQYKKDVKKAINSSGSFREFNIKMDKLKEQYTEQANDEDRGRAYKILNEIQSEATGTNLAKYKKVK